MAKKKVHSGPHKYQRVKWGKNGTIVFRCVVMDCPHYVHPEFVVGKQTLCWKCGKPCKMTRLRSLRAKPTCDDCMMEKKDSVLSDLEGLLGGLEEDNG